MPRDRPTINSRVSKKSRVQAMAKKKRAAGSQDIVQVPRGQLPLRLRNTMRYSTSVGVTITNGLGSHVFSCNGLYDPDITGTGHQPMYFDQLMALYDHYNVYGSKIEIVPQNVPSQGVTIAVVCDDDGSTHSATNFVSEYGHAVTRAFTNGGGMIPPIVKKWSQKLEFGEGASLSSDLVGSSSANPTEQTYFCISCNDPTLTSFTLYLRVDIEYYTEWTELRTVSTS